MWGVFSILGKQEVKILSSPTQIWTPRPPNYIYTAVKKYLRLPDFSVLGFVFFGGGGLRGLDCAYLSHFITKIRIRILY